MSIDRVNPASWAKEHLQEFLANPGDMPTYRLSADMSQLYASGALSGRERALADEILRDLVKDVEVRVRQAMAHYLKSCDVLPHDIAMRLATDVEAVALPILEYSHVLTDEDLIEIVQSQGEAHQSAIARRQEVSETVSDAIVSAGNEIPVVTLLENDGARLSQAAMENVVLLFPEQPSVTQALARRPDIPAPVLDKLANLVAEELRFEMMSRYNQSADLINKLMKQGSEDALLNVLQTYDTLEDVETLATEVYRSNRMTPTLVLRALYSGQLDFFEFGLARLAQMKADDARPLIHDSLGQAFKRLYRKTHFPAKLFKAFQEALETLGPDVARLDSGGWDGESRRLVSNIASREDFDRGEFESALTLTSG